MPATPRRAAPTSPTKTIRRHPAATVTATAAACIVATTAASPGGWHATWAVAVAVAVAITWGASAVTLLAAGWALHDSHGALPDAIRGVLGSQPSLAAELTPSGGMAGFLRAVTVDAETRPYDIV